MDHLRTSGVYLALFFLLTVHNAGSSQHNGTTVDHMLSRYKCKEDCSTPQGTDDDVLCWGYEKKCSKERRLFVPHCEGPAKPR